MYDIRHQRRRIEYRHQTIVSIGTRARACVLVFVCEWERLIFWSCRVSCWHCLLLNFVITISANKHRRISQTTREIAKKWANNAYVCAEVCVSASSPVLLFLQFIQLIPSIAITMCAPNVKRAVLFVCCAAWWCAAIYCLSDIVHSLSHSHTNDEWFRRCAMNTNTDAAHNSE